MGQRHQVFIVYPMKEEQKVIAFHHQWCYGSLPLKHLKRVIQYQTHSNINDTIGGKYSAYSCEEERIRGILSTSPSEGIYTHYINITNELVSKDGVSLDGGENNDGITIIKVDGSRKVSYCFMHISDSYGFEPLTSISARDYMLGYYPDKEQFKKFGGEKLTSYINKHANLLTIKELRGIFPKFYKGKKLELETIQNIPRDELPLMLSPKYSHNKALVEKRLKEA